MCVWSQPCENKTVPKQFPCRDKVFYSILSQKQDKLCSWQTLLLHRAKLIHPNEKTYCHCLITTSLCYLVMSPCHSVWLDEDTRNVSFRKMTFLSLEKCLKTLNETCYVMTSSRQKEFQQNSSHFQKFKKKKKCGFELKFKTTNLWFYLNS